MTFNINLILTELFRDVYRSSLIENESPQFIPKNHSLDIKKKCLPKSLSRTLLFLAEKTGIHHDHGYSYQKVVIWNPLMGNVYPWGYPLPWPPHRAASGLFE